MVNGVVAAVVLVDDRPSLVEMIVDVRHGVQEVARVRQPMTTQRAQVGQFPLRSPDLGDIASSLLVPGAETDRVPDAALDDRDLARLEEEHSQFGLDVQVALLGHDQKVAIQIAEGAVVHVRVDHEHVQRNPLAQIGVATAAQRV